jgi:hypothetical protein
MKNSIDKSWTVLARDVKVTDELVTFKLSDGRVISAPLAWYPRLMHGSRRERNNWDIGSGVGVHWPDLDEDISVENLLNGHASGESQKSLRHWLDQRKLKTAS